MPNDQDLVSNTTQKAKRALPPIVYKLMLVCATLIWGSTFVVMKDTVQILAPSWLLGIRFLITAVILAVVFLPRLLKTLNREAFISGSILGILVFGAYWFQTVGLVYTTPGKNAFLTATYCVLTPFIAWIILRKAPKPINIIAAVICLIGVGFVSLSNDALSVEFGDMMTLVCGAIFGIHLVLASKFSKTQDILVLTVYQFLIAGLLGILVGLGTETLPDLTQITPDFIFNMFYLIVFGSCVAMGFQNAALAHVAPSHAAILLSLESVFGVIFSVIFYGEVITVPLLVGFALIFGSIILNELKGQSTS